MIVSNYLNEDIQKSLRASGLITESEVVTQQGDLYIAVDVISKKQRIINIEKSGLNENTRRVLKG
jgi:hypothetical protein